MKKIIFAILLFLAILFEGHQLFAQGGPPPPPDDHGTNDNQPPGGGAPITEGFLILSSFGVAYGMKRAYNYFNESTE